MDFEKIRWHLGDQFYPLTILHHAAALNEHVLYAVVVGVLGGPCGLGEVSKNFSYLFLSRLCGH